MWGLEKWRYNYFMRLSVLQLVFSIFFLASFTLETSLALGNSDLDSECRQKKRRFHRMRLSHEWDFKLEVANVTKTLFIPNVVNAVCPFFEHLSRDERRKKKDPNALHNGLRYFSFFCKLALEHTRVSVSLIQVSPQLLCREMLPPSCHRKTRLCLRRAVCHQCRAPSEPETLSPSSRGTLLRAFRELQ